MTRKNLVVKIGEINTRYPVLTDSDGSKTQILANNQNGTSIWSISSPDTQGNKKQSIF